MTTQRTRINSRGKTIPSNYPTIQLSESLVECVGCGRRFSAYDLPFYSLAVDGPRIMAQNQARAARHADACKGKEAREV